MVIALFSYSHAFCVGPFVTLVTTQCMITIFDSARTHSTGVFVRRHCFGSVTPDLKNLYFFSDDGKFLPNFKYRYMTEDISFGLAVVKGIADIAGVDTPSIDKVLYWAQGILNKEYVVNGRLVGKDVGETRAPQRYGLITLKDILNEKI